MTQEQSAAHRAFIDQLNELREQAGHPTLSHLRKLSHNPLPNVAKRRELVPSTTQEILSGKRRLPPPWGWVVSYVAACHEAALEGSLDLGPMDVQTWRTRLTQARHGDLTVAAPHGRSTVVSDMAAAGTTRTAAQLTAEEVVQCYLATHGRIGARLARMAMNGDIEACFHLALLTLLRDCDHDGMVWLRCAAEAGHEAAAALQAAHDPRAQAADVAYRHGCALEAGGAVKASIARRFYQLAAETGHPEAVAKITGTAPSPPPQPPATPMAFPAFDISVPEPPPQLLDDASPLSYQLSLPQQHLPHMIESLPEQTSPADAPPAPSQLMQSPVAAQAEYGPAWPALRDLAGALKTAAAQAQDLEELEEAEDGASFAYTSGDPASDSHHDLPTWLFEAEQPSFPPWPDGQPP